MSPSITDGSVELSREEGLRIITDGVPALISYVDTEQRYQFNNEKYERWFGHPREEIRGRSVREVVGDAAYDDIRPHIEAALAGQEVRFETWLEYRGAGLRCVEAHYVPHRDSRGVVRGFFALVTDVTEHKRAEAALRASEERFRTAVESMTDCLGIFSAVRDASGAIVDFQVDFINAAASAHFESRGRGQVCRLLSEIQPAHRESELFSDYRDVVETGRPLVKDSFLLPGDDFGRDARIVDIRATKLGDGFLGVWRDVTEPRRAEELLRLRAEEWNALMEATPAAIWIAHDPESRKITGSRAGYEMLRMQIGENLSKTAGQGDPLPHFKVLKDGDELAPDELPIQQAARGAEVRSFEEEVVFDDGERLHLFGNAVPIHGPDGRVRGAVGAFVDITQRKQIEEALRQSEEALRESEERLRLATQAAAIGVWSWNIETNEVFWTPECHVIMGTREFGGTLEDFRRGVHPDDAEAVWSAVLDAIDHHRQYKAEFRIITSEGEVRWLLNHGRVEYTATGEATRVLGIVMDITQRKRSEQALQDSDRRKDEFLAMLAHELRNPLAPIRNAMQVLRRLGAPDGRNAQMYDIVDRQTEQLARMVDDLLDVSRIGQGKVTLCKEKVDLLTVVGRAVETSRPLIDAGGHTLTVSLPPEALRLEGDVARLAQVLSNLLNNAAKYTEKGGHIWLTAEAQDGEASIRVKDSGIGISAEALPGIFDLFAQADRALDRAQGGLGIGLTLVRNIVEMHDGTVRAFSAGLGQGSEFIVTLPLRSGHPHPAPADSGVPAAGGGDFARRLRILVVDDNVDTAESLALLLELGDQEARTAYDGRGALEVAKAFLPNVVLLDIGLPGMTGYEVVSALREQPEMQQAFIVALSGFGQEEDRERALEAGFDHHLIKPVDYEALKALINTRTRG